ncbi:GPI mannosyltransferase 3-like, partial [Argonauta hians]
YGYETWEWKHGLRGYLYPTTFTLLYKLLHLLHLDYRILLIKTPRMLQAVLSATGDYHTYLLSRQLRGRATAQWTLVCEALSWFLLYTYTRTLSNSAETALTAIALYYYPWPHTGTPTPRRRKRKALKGNKAEPGGTSNTSVATLKFLMLAGVAVIIRPTSVITWLPLCGWHFIKSASAKTVVTYVFAIWSCLLLSTTIDWSGYGRYVLVPLNFFHFNVVSGLAAHYGTHPTHWYLTQGLPVVMATHLLPFGAGVAEVVREWWRWRSGGGGGGGGRGKGCSRPRHVWVRQRQRRRRRHCAAEMCLLGVILWSVFVYSLLGHKEFRFVMPLLPLAMHFCGVYLHSVCTRDRQQQQQQQSSAAPHSTSQPSHTQHSEQQPSSSPSSPSSSLSSSSSSSSLTTTTATTMSSHDGGGGGGGGGGG